MNVLIDIVVGFFDFFNYKIAKARVEKNHRQDSVAITDETKSRYS